MQEQEFVLLNPFREYLITILGETSSKLGGEALTILKNPTAFPTHLKPIINENKKAIAKDD